MFLISLTISGGLCTNMSNETPNQLLDNNTVILAEKWPYSNFNGLYVPSSGVTIAMNNPTSSYQYDLHK